MPSPCPADAAVVMKMFATAGRRAWGGAPPAAPRRRRRCPGPGPAAGGARGGGPVLPAHAAQQVRVRHLRQGRAGPPAQGLVAGHGDPEDMTLSGSAGQSAHGTSALANICLVLALRNNVK